MYGNSEKNRNRTLCMLGFLGLLIAQGKMSALSTHSAAQEAAIRCDREWSKSRNSVYYCEYRLIKGKQHPEM